MRGVGDKYRESIRNYLVSAQRAPSRSSRAYARALVAYLPPLRLRRRRWRSPTEHARGGGAGGPGAGGPVPGERALGVGLHKRRPGELHRHGELHRVPRGVHVRPERAAGKAGAGSKR